MGTATKTRSRKARNKVVPITAEPTVEVIHEDDRPLLQRLVWLQQVCNVEQSVLQQHTQERDVITNKMAAKYGLDATRGDAVDEAWNIKRGVQDG